MSLIVISIHYSDKVYLFQNVLLVHMALTVNPNVTHVYTGYVTNGTGTVHMVALRVLKEMTVI
jgi:hypothetical protein